MLKKNKKKLLFFVFFISLFLFSLTQKQIVRQIKKTLGFNSTLFAKTLKFKGYVLINNIALKKLTSNFYNNLFIQTGNHSFVTLALSTKEVIQIQPNSQVTINQKENNHSVLIILKAGNLKLLKKNLQAKSSILYQDKISLLSMWIASKIKLKTPALTTSKILQKTHLPKILNERKPKETFFYLAKKYKKYFLYCQANAVRKTLKPTGKMLVHLHIVNNQVIDTYIISSDLNSYLKTCALSIFKKMKLRFNKKQDIWIRYPLYFK